MYSNIRLSSTGQGDTVITAPVSVPNDFFGMCFMSGANPAFTTGSSLQSTANHAGVLNVKWVRGCQQTGTKWADIETSDNVFNFTAMEYAVTRAKQTGAKFSHGIYGTPQFYADNTTPKPTVTDFNARGPWGGLGEGAMPTDLTKLARYVTAVLTHFNAPNGAWRLANPTLGQGVEIVETANEPGQTGVNGATVIGGVGNGFGWWSAAQGVDRAKTIIDAVRAFESAYNQRVEIDLEGFSGAGTVLDFLNATGAVSGVQGKNLNFDNVCIHPYNHLPIGYPFYTANGADTYKEYIDYGPNGIKALKAQLAAIGVNKPIVISEVAVDGVNTNPTIIKWSNTESAQFRYVWLIQLMIDYALLGVRRVSWWNWAISPPVHTVSFSGFWQQDPQAGNWIVSKISGKTIIDARANAKLRWLKFSDGSQVTINNFSPIENFI